MYLTIFVFSNNSIEVSVLEICEKELFQFDNLTPDTTETDSAPGKIGAALQTKTFKIFSNARN